MNIAQQEGLVITTGIPSLDAIVGGGLHAGDWVGIAGEPGSMKTVLCTKITGEWLVNNEQWCAIYVTTEMNGEMMLRQFKSLGYDDKDNGIDCYINSKQFAVIDACTPGKTPATPEAISRKVVEWARSPDVQSYKQNGGRFLLVIDSLAPLWSHAAVKARDAFSTLVKNIKGIVDVVIVTLQWAAAGHEFGWGAGHSVDMLIYTGTWYQDEGKFWIQIGKSRTRKTRSRLFDLVLNGNNELAVGEPISIPGKYMTAREALESMKYYNRAQVLDEIPRQRNALIDQQNKNIKDLADKIEAIIQQSKK